MTEGLDVILDVAQLCKVGRGGGPEPGSDLVAVPILHNKALFVSVGLFED